jgi:hypothetical protein
MKGQPRRSRFVVVQNAKDHHHETVAILTGSVNHTQLNFPA